MMKSAEFHEIRRISCICQMSQGPMVLFFLRKENSVSSLTFSEVANTYLYHYEYRTSLSSYSKWIIADHAHEIPMMIGKQFEKNVLTFPLMVHQEKKQAMY